MKLDFPATGRNSIPIAEVLGPALAPRSFICEIASGSGQHVAHFAAAWPHHIWQPSDPDPAHRASIDAHCREAQLANVRPALALDTTTPDWHAPLVSARNEPDLATRPAALLCINMIHIAPWSACLGLLAGAATWLRPGELLYLYGPFMQGGAHTADSNRTFDADLRARNPAWGVRDLDAVAAVATAAGFAKPDVIAMPANNLSVLFRRAPA